MAENIEGWKEKQEERRQREKEEFESRRKAVQNPGHIGNILAAINPDLYYGGKPNELKEFKNTLKKEGFWKSVSEAKDKPITQHKIIYESSSETLEPIYFWILDFMGDFFGNKIEKIVDNFTSSPGSGHFSELMMKATKMQEEALKLKQTAGILIKSIINLIYDLREFEIRLASYKAANSKNKDKAEAGLLALKQIWMDQVDIKRGAGSINALSTGNLNFVTLRDAFMAAKSIEDVAKKTEEGGMDLNDRVKRILKPRIHEFLEWKTRSYRELSKRYEIEKTHLKGDVSTLKLYSRWAKPYLKAALQLEQKQIGGERQPAMVAAFNSILLELALLGKTEVDMEQAIYNKELPASFKKEKLKRKYYSCALVDFYFRGIPQKVGQHYVFGGRAEVTFRGYVLNEDEIKMMNERLDESDLNDALKLISGMTDESLKQIQEDIDYFLKEDIELEKQQEEKGDDTNPFAALLGLKDKESKDKKDKENDKIEKIKPDNYIEKTIREIGKKEVIGIVFNLFDVYKKAHGMESLATIVTALADEE
tara:strand:+ start:800 stop:2410 length:1611 start_codon:yes stop_codon:yes gene_type:complete